MQLHCSSATYSPRSFQIASIHKFWGVTSNCYQLLRSISFSLSSAIPANHLQSCLNFKLHNIYVTSQMLLGKDRNWNKNTAILTLLGNQLLISLFYIPNKSWKQNTCFQMETSNIKQRGPKGCLQLPTVYLRHMDNWPGLLQVYRERKETKDAAKEVLIR